MTPTPPVVEAPVTVVAAPPAAPAPVAVPTESLGQEILHDIFILGIGAASIFVKNPASQQKAVTLVTILQGLFPNL